MTPIDVARRCVGAGISVIPVARDGTKAPAWELLPRVADEKTGRLHPSWNPFREAAPDREQVRAWWGGGDPPGIAALPGNLSGLELIDFDREAAELFPAWRDLVEIERPGLVDRLCVVRTPRRPAGYHVWLRCVDHAVPGNQALARLSIPEQRREKEDAKTQGRKAEVTLIETRGEGGYALIPGCPGYCHETGGEYRFLSGPALWELGTVSIEERDTLARCARLFSREVKEDGPPAAACGRGEPASGLRPGDDFDARGPDWREILEPHGWALAGSRGDERRWRRPGKDHGWSATTGHCRAQDGADLLRVFSSNAHPFEDGKAYGKFRAVSLLSFGGDAKETARALGRMGFGDRPKARAPTGDRPSPEEVEFVLRALEAAPPDRVRRLLKQVGHVR
jgi:hypothetical protein